MKASSFAQANQASYKNILLTGPPNCGKTTLFNWLTGFKNKTVNYPGSTVLISKGGLLKKYGLPAVAVADSPGAYSLSPQSDDEKTAVKALDADKKSKLLVLVLDASKLEVQLPLFFKLKEKGCSVLIALTMIDILPDSCRPQTEILSQELEAPVVLINGETGEGVLDLVEEIKKFKPAGFAKHQTPPAQDLFEYCKGIVQKSLKKPQELKKERERVFLSEKWDRFFLHPKWGFVFFAGIMFGLFSSIFWLAEPFMNLVDRLFSQMIDMSYQALSFSPELADFISNGLLAGLGAVLVFTPQIFILFIGISLLEDTGYLARAVSLMDGPFSKIGLSGKSFIPFLSGYACAIPAILLAKNLKSQREKNIVFFSVPFMSCSARLPVYVLLLSFLFYNSSGWKAGLALTLIYLGSFLIGMISVALLNRFLKKEKSESFILDLPIYRRPSPLKVINRALRQSRHYVFKAGPPIFFLSVLIWILTNYPSNLALSELERASQSWGAQLGVMLEPAFQLMGMDWRVGFALIAAFAAREVFVSALILIFMITKGAEETLINSLLGVMKTAAHSDGSLIFTTPGALSLIVFFMFSLQCLSTSAVIYKESGSLKFATAQFIILNGLAYLLAVISYQSLSVIL